MNRSTVHTRGATDMLAGLFRDVAGEELSVRLRAWDGSEMGPTGGPVLVLHDRTVPRRMLWHRDEIGVAQAFAAGEIDLHGDLTEGMSRLWGQVRNLRRTHTRIGFGHALRAATLAVRWGVLGPRPPAPVRAATLSGAVHSRERDRAAVSHHYDLSNDFYRLILDPTMAYSCGYWTSDAPDHTLARAQYDKLDLISRKLRLRPGTRLLDVGCGWGALAVHAARHHRVRVTAVTLAEQQRSFVAARVAASGRLTGRRSVHRNLHRDGHAHATGRRNRCPARAGRTRRPRRPRHAGALGPDHQSVAGRPGVLRRHSRIAGLQGYADGEAISQH